MSSFYEDPQPDFSQFQRSAGPDQTVVVGASQGRLKREVRLNMGIDHAFLFKPYREWMVPSVKWIEESD